MAKRLNPKLTKEVLYDLYVVQGKTRYEIAPLFGYKPGGISKRLSEWGITKFRAKGTGTYYNGYRMITVGGKQIFEHRHVMECYLGRPLLTEERVHHKNHIKLDNRLENLEIVSMSEHKRDHHPEIGKSTQFKQIYNFTPEMALSLFRQYKSSQKVANVLGCAEVTARRAITGIAGKSLKELKKTL